MREEWRPIYRYTGIYEVSNKGRVRSLGQYDSLHRWRVGRILKPGTNSKGYPGVVLAKQGIQKSKTVHSLVALAFLGPRKGRIILHGRQGKSVNTVSNLRYGTYSDNTLDSYRDGTMTNAKAVICLTTGQTFRSENEAALQLNVSQPGISDVCRGKQKTIGGLVFSFQS